MRGVIFIFPLPVYGERVPSELASEGGEGALKIAPHPIAFTAFRRSTSPRKRGER
jgi:hypothetical protein